MKRSRLRVLLLVPVVAGLTLLAPPATAGAAGCSTPWGSRAKSAAPATSPAAGHLTGVRAGRQTCYDRLVLDLSGPSRTGYTVRYVTAVTQDASGRVVPLRGGARLQVTVQAPAYDGAGRPTYRPDHRRELVDVAGYRTLRQVAWAGSFEGVTTVGLGVRARLPFRVFTLTGPGGSTRLVVDVAHRW